MAERTAIFNLRVEDGKSAKKVAQNEKNLNKFRKSAQQAGKGTQDFSKRLQAVNKVVDSNAFSFREANKLIQDYQTIAIQAGKDSPVGQEAIRKAAQLTDEMGKLRAETNNLAQDGKNLQGAMQLSQGVLGGYQAFAGVTAMLGVENEQLMQTMVKLQAVQQVSMGIESARKSLEEGQAARLLLMNVRTKALAIGTGAYAGAQNLLNLAIGKGSIAMKAFRGALVATGIGAIVVGVGLLVQNWDKLSDAFTSSVESLKEFVNNSVVLRAALAPIRLLILGIRKGLEALGIVESEQEALKREAAEANAKRIREERKANRQLIQDKIDGLEREKKAIEDKTDFEIRKAQALGQNITDLERQKMQAVLHSNRKQIGSIDELIDALQDEIKIKMLTGQIVNDELRQIEKLIKQRQNLRDEIKSTAQDLEIFEIKQGQKSRDLKKKNAEEEAKEEEARQQELQKLRDTATDLMIQSIEDEEERKRTALSVAHAREREQLIEKYGEDTELLKALEENQFDQLMSLEEELDAKAEEARQLAEENQRNEELLRLENDLLQMELDFNERLEKELELEEMRREYLLENDELTAEERRKIEIESAQKMDEINAQRVEREQQASEAIQQARQGVADSALSVLGQLSSMAEEGSAAAKAIAIAEIGAQTAMGFVRGLGIAQQASVAAGPAAPFVFPAFYGAQIASVLGAANKARGILGSGGGVSAPSASSAPSVGGGRESGEGSVNTRQDAEGRSTDSKVFVSETDISRTQDRVNQINVRSSF